MVAVDGLEPSPPVYEAGHLPLIVNRDCMTLSRAVKLCGGFHHRLAVLRSAALEVLANLFKFFFTNKEFLDIHAFRRYAIGEAIAKILMPDEVTFLVMNRLRCTIHTARAFIANWL